MSAAHNRAEEHGQDEITGGLLGAAPDVVEVRRNGGLAGLVGVVASAVAIAWLARAVQTGAVLDWVLFAVTGVLGAVWLHSFVDARTPLLVADPLGVRLRLGRVWRGLPWGAIERIEHTPRGGLFHDGRLVVHPHSPERVLAELDATGRRQSAWSQRLHGAPLAVPLGLSTRVGDLAEDLTTSLRVLAGAGTAVIEVDHGKPEGHPHESDDPSAGEGRTGERIAKEDRADEDRADEDRADEDRADDRTTGERSTTTGTALVADDAVARFEGDDPGPSRMRAVLLGVRRNLAERIARTDVPGAWEVEATAPTVRASATPSPLREPAPVARIEIRSNLFVEGATARKLDTDDTEGHDLPEGRELRREGSVSLVEDRLVWGDRVSPIATAGEPVEPLVIDDFAVEPAPEPIIGPELAAARTRIGLSVDALAERTRIRPHVIESIEVDDFHACGGDFYARGHLRTLARVLGLDAGPLLVSYDEKYADAPINPRRVFEAELATGTGGGIRATRGGPNWSLLVAVLMALVLAWSIARLAMDSPVEIQNPSPVLNGSDGPNQTAPMDDNVTLKVTANSATDLEIRDGNGKVVFDDEVDFGEVHRIDVLPPVRVSAEDAGAIDVEVDGEDRGTMGADGQEASKTYRTG